jgi:sodium/potassium/calcium exchanger 6
MILALLSVPAILVLTLTLPVVDDGRGNEGEGNIALPVGEDEPLTDEERLYRADIEAGTATDIRERHGFEDEDRMLRADVGEELHHLVEGGFSPLHSPLRRIHQHTHHHHQYQQKSPLLRRISEGNGDRGREGPEGNEARELSKDEDEVDEEEEDDEDELGFNKWLTAAQCVFGPMFCVLVVFRKLPSHYHIGDST